MNQLQCAWCGKKLEATAREKISTFCCGHCERQYEAWSRDRAMLRSEAVCRWRDTPVNGRDDLDSVVLANVDLPAWNGHAARN